MPSINYPTDALVQSAKWKAENQQNEDHRYDPLFNAITQNNVSSAMNERATDRSGRDKLFAEILRTHALTDTQSGQPVDVNTTAKVYKDFVDGNKIPDNIAAVPVKNNKGVFLQYNDKSKKWENTNIGTGSEDNKPLPNAGAAADRVGMADKNFDYKIQRDIEKGINPASQSSRQGLGQAFTNNMRSFRIDQSVAAVSRGDVIPDQKVLDQMTVDLDGIYKQGVPDQVQIQQGRYESMYSAAARLKTWLTAEPTAVKNADFIKQIIALNSAIKEVDNKVIKDNLNFWYESNQDWIDSSEKNQKWWDRTNNAVIKMLSSPNQALEQQILANDKREQQFGVQQDQNQPQPVIPQSGMQQPAPAIPQPQPAIPRPGAQPGLHSAVNARVQQAVQQQLQSGMPPQAVSAVLRKRGLNPQDYGLQ